jgi:hypothetical protein
MTTSNITNINANATINVNGIDYVITETHTIEAMRSEGHGNMADWLQEQGVVAELICRRPRGQKLHLVRVINHRSKLIEGYEFSHVLSLR